MMKYKIILLLISSSILTAQELPPTPAVTAQNPVTVVGTAPTTFTQLPEAEQRLRIGLVMLDRLEQILAGIKDNESAEAAVAPLMRLSRELEAWAHSFTELPPLSETAQQTYEDAYLPPIRKVNARIRTQGERLAVAEYYGSDNLTAALIHLALLNR